MKDKNGIEIKAGDMVSCTGLEFKIKEFKYMLGETLACGEYGCFNIILLEKITGGNHENNEKI